MIDAQPGDDGWLVPVAVIHALFDDPEAAESAYRAAKALADTHGSGPAPRNPLWQSAARHGLADPSCARLRSRVSEPRPRRCRGSVRAGTSRTPSTPSTNATYCAVDVPPTTAIGS